MNKILFLLFFLPALGLAQNKKDNTIVATGVSFKQTVNILLDAGYIIDKIDSNYYTLTTEYKKLCAKCIPEISVYIRVKDSVATVTGKWREIETVVGQAFTGNTQYYYYDVINERRKSGRMCFREMDRIAKLLSTNVT